MRSECGTVASAKVRIASPKPHLKFLSDSCSAAALLPQVSVTLGDPKIGMVFPAGFCSTIDSVMGTRLGRLQRKRYTIGTDFSGAEAPMWAMKALNLQVDHKWSCDWAPRAESFIRANMSPQRFYSNILQRDHSQLPAVDVYCAGFPCTPFSMLHNKSRLLRDPAAKQFRATIATIATAKPKVAILENVKGIMRKTVWSKVLAALRRQLKDYLIVYQCMCRSELGACVLRPRVYILAIRKDVAKTSAEEMELLVRQSWQKAADGKRPTHLSEHVLPQTHPLVMSHERAAAKTPKKTVSDANVKAELTPKEATFSVKSAAGASTSLKRKRAPSSTRDAGGAKKALRKAVTFSIGSASVRGTSSTTKPYGHERPEGEKGSDLICGRRCKT